jgi:hypothetical protein
MNKASVTCIGAAAMALLLGCSTQKPEIPEPGTPPPPEISFDLPLEQPGLDGLPRLCTLGESCLAMDPRPFEPCLLSTKECSDKAAEPMQVEQPQQPPVPPPVIKTTR